MKNQPNVLLIIMDSVRAENTNIHNYDRETLPYISKLAEQCVNFEHAKSPSAKSLTSHASMFTGLHVEEHNITSTEKKLDPKETIWRELSNGYGYSTGVFSGNTFLTRLETGLSSSFEHVFSGSELKFETGLNPAEYYSDGDLEYINFVLDSFKDLSPLRSFLNGISKLRSDRDADKYASEFLNWKETVDGPWAATINFMDAHTQYQPPSEFNRWANNGASKIMRDVNDSVWEFQCGHRPWAERAELMNLYDGCIRYIDSQVSRIVESLKHAEEYSETLIIITADHGEGFGEKSRIRPNTRLAGHGESKIHEAVLHVPLLIKFPDQVEGFTVEEPVSLTYLPEIIKSSLDGTNDVERFINAGPVLSTAVGLSDTDAESGKSSRYCDNLDNFTGYARAIFTDQKNGVAKHMTWDEKECVIQIGKENVCDFSETDSRKLVEQKFANICDAGVSQKSHKEIDDAVYDRLEELGYA